MGPILKEVVNLETCMWYSTPMVSRAASSLHPMPRNHEGPFARKPHKQRCHEGGWRAARCGVLRRRAVQQLVGWFRPRRGKGTLTDSSSSKRADVVEDLAPAGAPL